MKEPCLRNSTITHRKNAKAAFFMKGKVLLMKKIVAVLLSCMMCISLSACGSSDAGQTDTEAEVQKGNETENGNQAVLTSTSALTANAYGAKGTFRMEGISHYEKRDGKWIMINDPK